MHSTIIEGQSQNYGMEKESQRNTHNNHLITHSFPILSLLNNVNKNGKKNTVAKFFAGCNDSFYFLLNNYVVFFIEYLSKGSVYIFFSWLMMKN